jgi:N-acetyl-gamma-glutamylphosphate reductase
MRRIDVGVLGATGMVGQQFALQLAEHPAAQGVVPHGHELVAEHAGAAVLNAELMQAEGRL